MGIAEHITMNFGIHVMHFASDLSLIWVRSRYNLAVGSYQTVEDRAWIVVFNKPIHPRLQVDHRWTSSKKYLFSV